MVAEVVSLFTGLPGFEIAQQALEELNKGKRGHYNKVPKPKRTENKWEYMRGLYKQLANFLDVPYFFNEDKVFLFSYNRIKARCLYDDGSAYEYEGKTYEGEVIKIREAEIVGTENYDIDTRISLHQELINYLEDGFNLDDAVDNIQDKLRELKERHKTGEFAQWLKRHRG